MPLAWVAIDFDSIDGYLGRLSSSRRKNIRRKLRSRDDLQIDCIATGDPALADPRLQAELHALYLGVYAQSAVHFDQLDLPYLQHLLADSQGQGRMFLYRHEGQLIGWNLCYVHAGKLVDKYIGLAYPQSREHNLYAVSWMHNLEYALQHSLSHYVAGWTDSRIKAELGPASPPPGTRSTPAHRCCAPHCAGWPRICRANLMEAVERCRCVPR